MITRPMLAESIELPYDDKLTEQQNQAIQIPILEQVLSFPVLVSPKLDGIRCIVVDGQALSRKFKPIPNTFIRKTIEFICPSGFDGEIMIPGRTFNEISSAVMSEGGEPVDFIFNVFDMVEGNLTQEFQERYDDNLWRWLGSIKREYGKFAQHVQGVQHVLVESAQEILTLEKMWLEQGYEGVMVRSLSGPYKCGRSTLREQYLLKIKQFEHFEAEVVGFEERKTNTNKQEKNELGLTKRSLAKAGMKPAGTLGRFIVKSLQDVIHIKTGDELVVGSGTGLTKQLRQHVWDNQETYLGKIIRCKYQKAGAKDKPRFITFDGFRDKKDM